MSAILKKFKENKHGNDYVVGDIHGMYDLLMSKIKEIGFDKSKDRLFSVGDIIDRGPDSLKCLALCYEPWFHPVRGNHEQMMFDSLFGFIDPSIWFINGGMWYIDECGDELDATIQDLSERLPHGIEIETPIGKVGIVHADIPFDDWDMAFSTKGDYLIQTMLWSRKRHDRGYGHDIIGVDTLYVGHTPVKDPFNIANVRYVDVGSVYSEKIHIEKIY